MRQLYKNVILAVCFVFLAILALDILAYTYVDNFLKKGYSALPPNVTYDIGFPSLLPRVYFKVPITLHFPYGDMEASLLVSPAANAIPSDAIFSLKRDYSPSEQEIPEEVQQEVPKSEKPNVSLYIMSFCPFGYPTMLNYLPVASALQDNISFSLHYIVSDRGYECEEYNGAKLCSLHGNKELHEDARQAYLLRNLSLQEFYDYVSCLYENCTLDNVDDCYSKCLGYELDWHLGWGYLLEDSKICEENNVFASPTLLVNGVEYRGSRTTEDMLSFTCNAFLEPPKVCEVGLNATEYRVQGGRC